MSAREHPDYPTIPRSLPSTWSQRESHRFMDAHRVSWLHSAKNRHLLLANPWINSELHRSGRQPNRHRFMSSQESALVLLLLTHYPWIVYVCLKMHKPLVFPDIATRKASHQGPYAPSTGISQRHEQGTRTQRVAMLLKARELDLAKRIMSNMTIGTRQVVSALLRHDHPKHDESDCQMVKFLLAPREAIPEHLGPMDLIDHVEKFTADTLDLGMLYDRSSTWDELEPVNYELEPVHRGPHVTETSCVNCFELCLTRQLEQFRRLFSPQEVEQRVLRLITSVIHTQTAARSRSGRAFLMWSDNSVDWSDNLPALLHSILTLAMDSISPSMAQQLLFQMIIETYYRDERFIECVEVVLDAKCGANVNGLLPTTQHAKCWSTYTPLAFAAALDLHDLVSLFLSRGAKVNQGNPLFHAARSLALQVGTHEEDFDEKNRIHFFLHGIYPPLPSEERYVTSALRSMRDNTQIGLESLTLLLDAGANVNDAVKGSTALHELATLKTLDIFLEIAKEDDRDSDTSSEELSEGEEYLGDQLDSVETAMSMLVARGAKRGAKSASGETPFQAALRSGHRPGALGVLDGAQPKITSFLKKKEKGQDTRGKRNR